MTGDAEMRMPRGEALHGSDARALLDTAEIEGVATFEIHDGEIAAFAVRSLR
jgi:hypothetical protein